MFYWLLLVDLLEYTLVLKKCKIQSVIENCIRLLCFTGSFLVDLLEYALVLSQSELGSEVSTKRVYKTPQNFQNKNAIFENLSPNLDYRLEFHFSLFL